jgi:hypothetical protein
MALILAHNRAQSVNQRAAVPKTLTNFVLSSVCSRDTERASLPNTGPPAETGRSPCKLHASFSLSHAISCRIVSHHKLVSQLMSLAQPPASDHRQKVPKHRKHLRSFAWSSGGGPCDGGHSSIMEMAMDTHLIMQLALTTWWAPSLDQTYVQVKIFQCHTDQKGCCWLLSWHCPLPKVSHPQIDLINAMFTISTFTISTCNAINTKNWHSVNLTPARSASATQPGTPQCAHH